MRSNVGTSGEVCLAGTNDTVQQLALPLESVEAPNRCALLERTTAQLQFPGFDTTVGAQALPKRRRKGRKSMNRRRGQNGTVVIRAGWYRVRFRLDVTGQEERVYMSEKVAPVAFDKEGNPRPPSQQVRRMARGIVERSGANSEEQFNRVVLGHTTLREQAKIYLRWAETRDREPIRDTSSIEAALNKWILPEIGDLPLASVNNVTVKPLVAKMKKSLSPCAVNKYIQYVKQIVGSMKDPETGEPIHRRTWDSTVMDLPVVKQKEQRRPALKAKSVDQLVRDSEGDEQALYLIAAATGMRISETLAVEISLGTLGDQEERRGPPFLGRRPPTGALSSKLQAEAKYPPPT